MDFLKDFFINSIIRNSVSFTVFPEKQKNRGSTVLGTKRIEQLTPLKLLVQSYSVHDNCDMVINNFVRLEKWCTDILYDYNYLYKLFLNVHF